MKSKVLIFLCLSTVLLLYCVPVYAGSINGNESAILGVLEGGFEVDGVQYKVDSSYISQASGYFSQDDVDLTADQKAEAISSLYANAKQGVIEGYLIPVNGSSSSNKEDKDNSEDKDNKGNNKNKTDTKNEKKTSQSITKKKAKEKKAKIEIDDNKASINVLDVEGKTIYQAETIIKNTGFSLNATYIICFGLGALFLVCLYITFHYKLYRKEGDKDDE